MRLLGSGDCKRDATGSVRAVAMLRASASLTPTFAIIVVGPSVAS
jgi:hypothetical protein